jgi:hypothetical protein
MHIVQQLYTSNSYQCYQKSAIKEKTKSLAHNIKCPQLPTDTVASFRNQYGIRTLRLIHAPVPTIHYNCIIKLLIKFSYMH